MIARLLVALLTLALAFPAMAMPLCHTIEASAVPVTAHTGHAMAIPSDPAPGAPAKPNPHADAMCIGCIAPSTVRPPIVAARLFETSIRAAAYVPNGAPLGQGPPATPPPRLHG